jgi:hypothetical protein
VSLLDVLASWAACAAFAGLALAALSTSEHAVALVVESLFLGSGEFGRLARYGFGLLWFARCGPGLGLWKLRRTPQIGVQGNAKEGVNADSEVVGSGACSTVEGWWKSE